MCTAILPSASTSFHTAPHSSPLSDPFSTAHAAQRAKLIVQYCRNGDFHNALMIAFADPHVQINQRDCDGETPLGWAAYYGNVEMVKWFINKGANVNARTNTGWSPLMNATSRCHASIVSLLLRAQASLDHTTQHGNTCLHLAADKGMDEICKMLLEAGAPVNVRNVYGDTPLMLACWSGHLTCVQLLLASAAELEWVTIKKHRSALNIACHMSHTKIIEYLVAFGASVELASVGYVSPYTKCNNSIAIEAGRQLASSKEQRTKMVLIECGIVRDLASMVNDYLYAPIPIIDVDTHKNTMVSDSRDFETYLHDVNRWNGPSGHQQLFRALSPFLNHPGTTYDVDKFRTLISIPQTPQSDWKQHWRDIKEAMQYDVAMDVNICAVQFLFQE